MAIRVSLSENRGLSWANPRWQRFLALAFAVLALGLLCRTLSTAGYWIVYWSDYGYAWLGERTFFAVVRLSRFLHGASPLLCGLGLCMLAKGEQRYPDTSRAARRITLSAGVIVLSLGALEGFLLPPLRRSVPTWAFYILTPLQTGPWIPLTIKVIGCAYASDLSKRGGSRLLSKLAQLPVWPTACGLVVWLFGLNRLYWPMSSILLNWLFPISMIVMLAAAVRLLLRSASEADLNWVSDP